MKKILFVLLAVAIAISTFVMCVSAEENEIPETDISDENTPSEDVSEDASEDVSDEASEEPESSDALDTEVKLEYKGFGNEGFSRNLKYMGLGMLGIFAVVGVVIVITFVLNKVTAKKS